jgi:acetate kinase
MRILAVNAGSSSLKLSLIGEQDELLASAELTGASAESRERLARELGGELGAADGVVHRIVHGGPRHGAALHIDRTLREALDVLTDLAPLHQPRSLHALDAVSALLPELPAVACFDTAFHRDMPAAARTYALPEAWRSRWELQRYGFHGLSHAWVARRVTELSLGRVSRLVSCHLGAGASVCAIRDGRSVDTTMGFTPLDGLVMATRCGAIDPGLVLWLLEHAGIEPGALTHALEHDSGLRALAGTADMRNVIAGARGGEPRAELALQVYLRALRGAIAAMAAALGGIDALSFTGGVGEHAPTLRAACAEGLGFLGIAIDPERNAEASGDRTLSAPGAAVRVLRLRAREDLEMARQARELLTGSAPAAG